MSPRIGLVTFGGGLPNWRAAANRLGQQAVSSEFFTNTWVISDRQLAAEFPEFTRQNAGMLRMSNRGYGYWIWKPFIILQALRRWSGSCDYVIYLDAGFHINDATTNAKNRLMEYLALAESDLGVGGMTLPGHPEIRWTKREVVAALQLSDAEQRSDQIQATPMVKMGTPAQDFCAYWLELCTRDDYALVRDPDQSSRQIDGFVAHRHDQSVFSCLGKTLNMKTMVDETYWHPDWVREGKDFPLWAVRNRSRVDFLDMSVRGRSLRLLEKSYSRLAMEWNARRG